MVMVGYLCTVATLPFRRLGFICSPRLHLKMSFIPVITPVLSDPSEIIIISGFAAFVLLHI